MAGKKVQKGAENMVPVRFYYRFEVRGVFPGVPVASGKGRSSSRRSEQDQLSSYAERVAEHVGDLLGKGFDGAVVDGCELLDRENGLCVIRLVTCAMRDVTESAFSGSHKAIRRPALSMVDRELVGKISDSLSANYRLGGISRIFVASRSFGLEITFGGRLVLEREITDENVDDAGSVSRIFELCEEELSSAIEGHRLRVSLSSPRRRRADNRYQFDFVYEVILGFSERDVVVGVVDLYKELDEKSARSYSVELETGVYDRVNTDVFAQLADPIYWDDILPIEFEFVSTNGLWVEWPDELFDADNEIAT